MRLGAMQNFVDDCAIGFTFVPSSKVHLVDAGAAGMCGLWAAGRMFFCLGRAPILIDQSAVKGEFKLPHAESHLLA